MRYSFILLPSLAYLFCAASETPAQFWFIACLSPLFLSIRPAAPDYALLRPSAETADHLLQLLGYPDPDFRK
ncbi:MAG TPA: hypothetical protein VIL66_00570 [Bacillota bacterium]